MLDHHRVQIYRRQKIWPKLQIGKFGSTNSILAKFLQHACSHKTDLTDGLLCCQGTLPIDISDSDVFYDRKEIMLVTPGSANRSSCSINENPTVITGEFFGKTEFAKNSLSSFNQHKFCKQVIKCSLLSQIIFRTWLQMTDIRGVAIK